MAKITKFLILYFVQAACLWIGLETSTYLQGDALKIFLQDYWLVFYAVPLLTTMFIFKEVQDAPLSALVRGPEQQCLAAYAEGQSAWRYNQFAFFFAGDGRSTCLSPSYLFFSACMWSFFLIFPLLLKMLLFSLWLSCFLA